MGGRRGAAEVTELMAARDFDASEFLASGQLVVKDRTETYLGSGRFDAQAMLNCIRDEARESEGKGYPGIGSRVISPGLRPASRVPRAPRVRVRLDELLRDTGYIGVCQYDTRQLAQPR